MKIIVWTRDDTSYSSEHYNISFHGVELKDNIYRFLSEQVPLTCEHKDGTGARYIPSREIIEIIEMEK